MISSLIDSSVRVVLIAGTVAAILCALRISDPRARHAAWCGVLASMLLLPGYCTWGPKAPLRVLPARDAASGMGADLTVPVSPSPSIPAAAMALPPQQAAKPDLLWVAYLLVSGIFMLRLVHGILRANALRRRARPGDGFLTSAECACPITLGWWRPVVVLPVGWAAWPKQELDAVLAHERAHVRRRDPLVQGLAAFNRAIFWFHPLAWWLERRLSGLAEDSCDAAAIASGHSVQDYCEYLIRQARTVAQAGGRIPDSGAAIGNRDISHRIRRLLSARPSPVPSRSRALLGTTICTVAIAVFSACQVDRKSSMHDLAMRRAQSNMKQEAHRKAIETRARSLTASEANQLLATLEQNPHDADIYWTLIRHYEWTGDIEGLDGLTLWYIEHQPGEEPAAGNIDPRIDRAGYEKGKSLWLGNVKRPGAPALFYRRAAEYLDGGDPSLAESLLQTGRKAYPDDPEWPMAFGRHYARVLLRSPEPADTEAVRRDLAASRDVPVLAATARALLRADQVRLARAYVDQALSVDPESAVAKSVQASLAERENFERVRQLEKLPAVELAGIPVHDRMLLALYRIREDSVRQNFGAAESKARNLLDLAARNPQDPLYGAAIFDAHMALGKAALRRSDVQSAVRHLLEAAETPGSGQVFRGNFDMNLPRALVDRGERQAVVNFFRRLAPKTLRRRQFEEWAARLSRGANPDLLPVFFAPGCSHDPC